ncbi:hypothetical protein D9613_009800 [Agrocybe pediades]|uniref:Uncharacterized protein n=1 Tax=Agrocybe pediades TaxID=84607 RepID=A0A8H4VQ90_9AGAR|nr:hypothetical protein D9613_009800 [Agrocybe pediades]
MSPSSMYFFVYACLMAGSIAASPLVINTPSSIVTGKPNLITWEGGNGKDCHSYMNSVLAPQESISEDIGAAPAGATSLVWIADLPAGTEVDFEIQDSTGVVKQSAFVTIIS